MRSSYHDVCGKDTTTLLDLSTDFLYQMAGYKKQINSNQRYTLLSIIKYDGTNLTRIME